jgi:hypothetical protein
MASSETPGRLFQRHNECRTGRKVTSSLNPTTPANLWHFSIDPAIGARDFPQSAAETVPMAADRPRSASRHESNWSVIRVTTGGYPPRDYALDARGRIAGKMPRQKKRVLKEKSPEPPPVPADAATVFLVRAPLPGG